MAILAAKQCEKINEILVTTDSKEIAEQAEFFGATVPSLRPTKLAQDDTTTEDTLKYALNEFETLNKIQFDLCVFDLHRHI